jgi:anti-sigma regulatory factor (Ser/Thr protein kinase)
VFLVLAELFNNALDHGLLALDSRIKNQPDGFERYAQLRQAKLQALTDGHISLQLERIGSGARALLKVTVTDSGPGFDQRALSAAVTPDGSTYSGRGLTLVRRLCASLRFNERGNEVVAYYAL